jgi:uncharacterized protein (TIGR00159 family)
MIPFGIKDIIDILLVAGLLFYIYRTMKESGALNIFVGVFAFIVAWIVVDKLLDMKLLGTIMDRIIDSGIFILIIVFQDQIKRFLTELGSKRGWKSIAKLWHSGEDKTERKKWIMPIVYACMTLSKSKTGALIVIKNSISLDDYEHSGDIIRAEVNNRLLENIFFKNSPLHDGAVIIDNGKIMAAGCILPVSHDTSLPKYLGLRHRSALGISQATDAIAVVVSEETGNISYAYRGEMHLKLSSTDLEHALSKLVEN